MGRAERRRQERAQRIADRKGKLLIRPDELSKIKEDVLNRTADFDVEVMMTCFALTLRRKYGFGKKRILRALMGVDELFGEVLSGQSELSDLKTVLEDEVGLRIKMET